MHAPAALSTGNARRISAFISGNFLRAPRVKQPVGEACGRAGTRPIDRTNGGNVKTRLVSVVLPVILGLGALVLSACELPLDTITLWSDTPLNAGFSETKTFSVSGATTAVQVFGTNTLTAGTLTIAVYEPGATNPVSGGSKTFTTSDGASYNWTLPAVDGTWKVTVAGDAVSTAGSFMMTAQYY
jgi:hypothetical protein